MFRWCVEYKKKSLTYSDLLVFSSRSQKLSIRAKADGTNVEIPIFAHRFVLQYAHPCRRGDVVNVRLSVATSGQITAVWTELDTAYNAIVIQCMH